VRPQIGLLIVKRRKERQRQLIADLARDGEDTVLAERELDVLIQSHEELELSKVRLLAGFQEDCKPDANAASISAAPPAKQQA
jgi:hypothetical protein